MVDPISAFVVGRLGVPYLQAQVVGLPAALRGNIILDALYQLYRETPGRRDIAAWSDGELDRRIQRVVDGAFARHERNSDKVLVELFKLERIRIAGLLRHFVNVDRSRDDFSIAHVEHEVAFAEADLRLQLRVDRIDQLPDGSFAILDYKTGATKQFLKSDGQPRDIQLVAYACAFDKPVSAIALVNIDTRELTFDGAGRGYTDEAYWEATLGAWKRDVGDACEAFSRGDVRINAVQNAQEARKMNLLSRYTELRRDG